MASEGKKDLLQLERIDYSSSTPEILSICKETGKQGKGRPKDGKKKSAGDFLQTVGESSVLNRVRAFLPILDESNKKLAMDIKEKGADGFNIEVLKEDEHAPYVEMDLALGVVDLQTPDAVSVVESLIGGQACVTETSAGSGLDSEHSDTDKEGEKSILQSTGTKRPKIEALS